MNTFVNQHVNFKRCMLKKTVLPESFYYSKSDKTYKILIIESSIQIVSVYEWAGDVFSNIIKYLSKYF